MYSVINLQGHQYIVQKGDKIVVDRIKDKKEGDKVDVKEVLALFDEEGKDVKVGRPFVEGATVSLKVLRHFRGPKLHVIKFKRKNRYSRKLGFRPELTEVEVVAVKASSSRKTKKSEEAAQPEQKDS